MLENKEADEENSDDEANANDEQEEKNEEDEDDEWTMESTTLGDWFCIGNCFVNYFLKVLFFIIMKMEEHLDRDLHTFFKSDNSLRSLAWP